MRVTSMLADMQFYMQQSSQAFATAEEQLSTGLRVNRPSDDPVAAAQYIGSLSDSSRADSYTTNVSSVLSRLQTADSAIAGMVTTLTSALSSGTQGANGTNNNTNMEGIAQQVEGFLASVVSQANTSYEGSYLFGGTENSAAPFVQAYASFTSSNGSNTAPLSDTTALSAGSVTKISDAATGLTMTFKATAGDTIATLKAAIADAVSDGTLSADVAASINASGQLQFNGAEGIVVSSTDDALGDTNATTNSKVANAYAYVGNSGVNQIQVGDTMTVNSNIAGDTLFGAGTGVLTALKALIDALRGGSTNEIGDATAAVSSALDNLTTARVPLDNTIGQLQTQETYLGNEKVTLTSRRKSLVEIDMAEAATNVTQAQLANNATLAAAAKSMGQSLLDYLK